MNKLKQVIKIVGLKGGLFLILYKYFFINLQFFKSTLEIIEWTIKHQVILTKEGKLLKLEGLPSLPKQVLHFRPFTSDVMVVKQHFFGNELFPIVSYFKTKGESPRKMIDAGGNIGLTSAYLQAQFPLLEVLLLEPSESNCLIARKNIDSSRTEIWQKALWWKEEILDLDQSQAAWAMKVSEKRNSRKVGVQGVSLSGILQSPRFENVDYIKVDIEGAEEDVFFKDVHLRTFLIRVECISVEPHSESFELFFKRYLEEINFRVIKSGELLIGFNKSF